MKKYQLINLVYGSVIFEGTWDECVTEQGKYEGLTLLFTAIRPSPQIAEGV